MMKTFLYVVIALVIAVGAVWYFSAGKNQGDVNTGVAGVAASTQTTETPKPEIKEFTMTAFYDATGPQFSLKEMTVKKGDTIVIKATNTKGTHDFAIDEYGIKRELPLNEEQAIGFTADKAGDFIYYCSKMDHRVKGQWGVLHVLP